MGTGAVENEGGTCHGEKKWRQSCSALANLVGWSLDMHVVLVVLVSVPDLGHTDRNLEPSENYTRANNMGEVVEESMPRRK